MKILPKHILNFTKWLASIATVVMAIAVCITLYNNIPIWKQQVLSDRPYFTVFEPGIKELPESPPYRVYIGMQNDGGRIATNVNGKIFFIDKKLQSEPISIVDVNIGNDIPPNSPTPWYNDNVILSNYINPMYIVLYLTYYDPIINQKQNQIIAMKWDGVQKGITHPDFTHVSIDEKKQVIDYLKEQYLLLETELDATEIQDCN